MSFISDNKYLEAFEIFVKEHAEFPLKDWLLFLGSVRFKQIQANDYLFKQGEKSNVIGFVVKGLIQTYYLNYEGIERTKSFAWEGRLISSWVYQIKNQPSEFTARALEDTTIIWISFERLEELQKKSHAITKLRLRCSEKILMERERRERELLTLDAAQRYDAFKERMAPIMDRVPQYVIASYLGITPVSLSRLIAKNKS